MSPITCLLDIETSPILGYTWTAWDASVLKVLEPSKVISVAWKELGDASVVCKALPDYRGYKKGKINDEGLIKEVWNILDKADIVIAHNGNSFDIKRLNARFVYYGLSAPSPYKTIDTLSVAKKYFKFDSNALNNLGQYLGVGEKINNGGFSLWTRCLEDGDLDAWSLMKQYNSEDVNLLERVYLKLRPYIQNHPNTSPSDDPAVSCPTCKSSNVSKRGFSTTRAGRKQRYQCLDCGSWHTGPYQRKKLNAMEETE